jgi:hypothetical protein
MLCSSAALSRHRLPALRCAPRLLRALRVCTACRLPALALLPHAHARRALAPAAASSPVPHIHAPLRLTPPEPLRSTPRAATAARGPLPPAPPRRLDPPRRDPHHTGLRPLRLPAATRSLRRHPASGLPSRCCQPPAPAPSRRPAHALASRSAACAPRPLRRRTRAPHASSRRACQAAPVRAAYAAGPSLVPLDPMQ